jgi:ABC-type multidrug transport system ATPase subunit
LNAAPVIGIRLQGVTKSFGARAALDGIDLDLAPGSYTALMGANGAGKTTLLNVISGLAVPSSGSVMIAGVEMRRAGPKLRRLIGVVGHSSMLYQDLTGRENLRFAARLYGLADIDEAVAEAAARLTVEEFLDRPVRTLSRGIKQRLSLARAMVHRPTVLLLDEPYTGLDEAAVVGLSDLLESLNTPDRLIVVALHEVARAVSGPQRLLVLSRGRMVADRPTQGSQADIAASYIGLLRSEVSA